MLNFILHKPMIKKLFFSCLLLLVLLTSCDNNSKQSKEEIVIDDKVIVLKIHAWEGYAVEHKEAFENYVREKLGYNVKLQISLTTGYNSFVKAIEKNDAHLISPANDLLEPLNSRKLILPFDVLKAPKYRQINPNILKKGAHQLNGVAYAVPFCFGPYSIAYNKDKMIAPESYKELWNPKYKKRVSISGDYDTLNIYITALMLGFTNIFNLNDQQLKLVEKN